MKPYKALGKLVKEFIADIKSKYQYQLVDLINCKKTGVKKAVLRVADHRYSFEIEIQKLIMEDNLISEMDPLAVRALSYYAAVERLEPSYTILAQELTQEAEKFILKIMDKKKNITEISVSDLSKDKQLFKKFSQEDAHKIGYMAGLSESDVENDFIKKMRDK